MATASDQARLIGIIEETDWFREVLHAVEPLFDVPWCIGAGVLAGLVWNRQTGRPSHHGIKDIDIVYFDPADLSAAGEAAREGAVQRSLPPGCPPADVKNQARVHLWYEQAFGYPIAPYTSLADALATWPTTATALGVTARQGALKVIAPFGLADLFALRVRANKRQITEPIFAAKAARWRTAWPELDVIDWHEG